MVEQKKASKANSSRQKTSTNAKVEKTVSIATQRCPHCGASDVSTNAKTGQLRCNFCRSEFEANSANTQGTIDTFENIRGDVVGVGASNIIPGEDIVVTLKCPSCGAEVVVNTANDLSLRCHWCRHILTVSHKIPNGAVPDLVLPFKLSKAKAIEKMKEWLEPYKASLAQDLVASLKLEELSGVYFPYMITDVKAHSSAYGLGEHTKSQDESGSVVEVYSVSRDFDLYVDDLTIEASSRRLHQDVAVNSNNVINAIMPFDTENAVSWNANYLRGFSSERRDTNINDLKELVALQSGDIARMRMKEMNEQYDRGLRWQKENLSVKGVNWKAAYLPVWLYSFRNTKESDARIYYIAVNARTGETDGVLPIKSLVDRRVGDNARHHHENETRNEIRELVKTDRYLQTKTGVRSREITGRNDNRVIGAASSGRSEMLNSERGRFKNGANYKSNNANSNFSKLIIGIIVAIMFLMIFSVFIEGCIGCAASNGSSKRRNYDSSYSTDHDDYDYDYSYDFDSYSNDSFDDVDGFTYDYDY